MNLADVLKRTSALNTGYTPQIFDFQRRKAREEVAKLFRRRSILFARDSYEEQLKEYFAVMNPALVYTPEFEDHFEAYRKEGANLLPSYQQGRWVYFPWNATIVHILEEKAFQRVRTARNMNLIRREEQEVFYKAAVGIAGLSVGNSVAAAIVLQGGGRHIRLADPDTLALSNTNRIRAGVESLGLKKAVMTAQHLYAINPYLHIEVLREGLTEKNLKKFFEGPPRLDIVVDEMDNLAMKYLLREHARRLKCPVVMGADNGDNAVVDIERYDRNPRLPFFHGRMGKVSHEGLKSLNKFGIGKMITKHVGPENVTSRMRESLLQMGKTIVSWPQLGGAALLNGAAVACSVRRILNHQPIISNRAIVSLDEKLIPGYDAPRARKARLKSAAAFKKMFGL